MIVQLVAQGLVFSMDIGAPLHMEAVGGIAHNADCCGRPSGYQSQVTPR